VESFDIGRAFGSALMTFAIFVIVQFVLAKIPALRQRYLVSAGIAAVLGVILLAATPAPVETMTLAFGMFFAACAWHFARYGKSASK